MFTSLNTKAARALLACTLAAALCAPGADARPQDLRMPDTRDAAEQAIGHQDLRPPDTRDAAAGYHPTLAPEPQSVAASGGFDWLSAAIGAAAGTGLMILAVALASTGRRRHRVLRA